MQQILKKKKRGKTTQTHIYLFSVSSPRNDPLNLDKKMPKGIPTNPLLEDNNSWDEEEGDEDENDDDDTEQILENNNDIYGESFVDDKVEVKMTHNSPKK